MDESDSRRRIVVSNGMDLDKRTRYEVTKLISRDADVVRLSILGPVLWNVAVLGLLGITAISLYSSVQSLLGAGQTLLANVRAVSIGSVVAFVSHNGLLVFGVLAVLAVIHGNLVKAVEGIVTGLYENAAELVGRVGQLRVLFRYDTWQNHNYWHPFTTHQSDRDPLAVLANSDLDADVNGVYADVPFYENVFVDSVYVTFDDVPGWRGMELHLFGERLRTPRRYAVLLLVGIAALYQFRDWLALSGTPVVRLVPWEVVGPASSWLLVSVPLFALATKHFRFHSYFYGDSAGFSEYGTLLNEDPRREMLDDNYDDVSLLGNSLAGYGVFYVSEFLRNVVGTDFAYRIRDETDGTEDADARAVEAGTAVLESSAPGMRPDADTVDVELCGVRYLRIDDEYDSRIESRWWPFGDRDDSERARLDVAGRERGIRLPVKKFVSVPSPITADENLAARGEFPVYFDEDWADDEVHYLLLGGAEHQQGISKLVRALKDQGYRNVDLLENTFAGSEDFKFTSEYFVSSVIAGDQPFRGDESFILFRHDLSADGEPDRYVYVLVGMSALATKMGFLYWLDSYPTFDDIDDDTIYHVEYDMEGDAAALDEGYFYQHTDWCAAESDRDLHFEWRGTVDGDATTEASEDELGFDHVAVEVRYE
ncbi:hypothetical protein VB773_05210 [Haloarculaceae archaeon H-GB2-1]|nr:hypothetical protein [Haloarculaceae archaeon H-GB1-1]MEA5388976.1 hypothetical protein [Haloarculaceae archaeon H-GB11]MEA5407034.1 hypothetical protein [Haloarculaceae archaeon H-GB2-1]